MIRLFAGYVAVAAAFGVFAQSANSIDSKEPSNSAPKAQTLSGRSGSTISSATINFSQLAAEPAPKKAQRHVRVHPKGSPYSEQAAANAALASSPTLANAPQTAALAPSVSSPQPGKNFLGTLDNDTFIPPDTMGAVGPRHMLVTVNSEFKVQTRDGQLISSTSLEQFWSRLGNTDVSDPHSFYDVESGRWFIVTIADFDLASAAVLIGCTETDDPTGVWHLYKIDADPTDTVWPDYPTMGMNSKWVAVAANNFSNGADIFSGAEVWAFDKQALVKGAATIPFKSFPVPSGFTLQPCVTLDKTESTLYLVENFAGNSLRISTITGPIGSESLNVGVAFANSQLGNWSLGGSDVGFQSGTSQTIECNDPRLLNAVFRNGSIWTAHSVFFPANGIPTRAAAQWWQVNPNGSVIQQGRIDDTSGTTSYGFPTIGVNRNNDALLGYTKFTTTSFASAGYSFRSGSDPLSTMRDGVIYKAGEASYFKDFGSGENRWGDFSMTLVDPLNDLDLWTIQEYASSPKGSTSEWGVWWAMVMLSTPPDGILDLQVNPPTLSDIALNVPTDFFVTVSDSTELITNATVTAQIPGRAAVTFRNDGSGSDVTAADNVYTASITLTDASQTPITFTATAPGKQPGSIIAAYNIVPRPANDNFANAAKIPSAGIFGENSAQVNNSFGTTEANEPLHAGVSNRRSLWWNYSTDTAGTILVDTSGTGPRVVVAVYSGNSLTSLIPVASTNAAPGEPAILYFSATPGVTYRIAVAGVNDGDKGLVRLRVQPNGQPDTVPPIVTVQYPPSGLVTNVALVEFRGTAIDPAPQASGVRSVLIEDLQTEPVNVVQATLAGTLWTATIPLREATNRYRVHGVDFADNASAPQEFVIYYRESAGTTNNLFGFARSLPVPSGVDFASNTNANREYNEPLYGGNEGGASLWWSYLPTKSGVLVISTEGSTFDTLLGVFTVNDPLNRSITSLIPVAQNDDSPDATDGHSEVSVAVEAGRLYYIAVDGYGGATGNVRLEYTFAETGVFNVTTSSSGGGTVSPGSATFPANSAVTVIATPDRYKQFADFRITQNGITTVVTNSPMYTFALTGPTEVVADFTTKQFADDFQTGDFSKLPYQISSTAELGQYWVVSLVETNSTTHEGSLAARVRPQLPDSTTASLVLVTNLASGVGSFEFTVNSETNFDRLEFSVDGQILGSWTGYIPWQTFFFDIPAKSAPIRLEWRYSKDIAITATNELVAIDNLDITTVPPPPPAPLSLGISADASQITITATGAKNTDFRLESSPDLVNWSPVVDGERNSGTTGVVTYIQPAPTGISRFYRVVQL